jgi:hypothetical protein
MEISEGYEDGIKFIIDVFTHHGGLFDHNKSK